MERECELNAYDEVMSKRRNPLMDNSYYAAEWYGSDDDDDRDYQSDDDDQDYRVVATREVTADTQNESTSVGQTVVNTVNYMWRLATSCCPVSTSNAKVNETNKQHYN